MLTDQLQILSIRPNACRSPTDGFGIICYSHSQFHEMLSCEGITSVKDNNNFNTCALISKGYCEEWVKGM